MKDMDLILDKFEALCRLYPDLAEALVMSKMDGSIFENLKSPKIELRIYQQNSLENLPKSIKENVQSLNFRDVTDDLQLDLIDFPNVDQILVDDSHTIYGLEIRNGHNLSYLQIDALKVTSLKLSHPERLKQVSVPISVLQYLHPTKCCNVEILHVVVFTDQRVNLERWTSVTELFVEGKYEDTKLNMRQTILPIGLKLLYLTRLSQDELIIPHLPLLQTLVVDEIRDLEKLTLLEPPLKITQLFLSDLNPTWQHLTLDKDYFPMLQSLTVASFNSDIKISGLSHLEKVVVYDFGENNTMNITNCSDGVVVISNEPGVKIDNLEIEKIVINEDEYSKFEICRKGTGLYEICYRESENMIWYEFKEYLPILRKLHHFFNA